MEYEVRLTAQAVEREIRSLKQHPARYPLTPEEPWHTYGVRKMIVKNFFVYYLIEEDKRQVAVTAVIYGRRDQIAALREMTLE